MAKVVNNNMSSVNALNTQNSMMKVAEAAVNLGDMIAEAGIARRSRMAVRASIRARRAIEAAIAAEKAANAAAFVLAKVSLAVLKGRRMAYQRRIAFRCVSRTMHACANGIKTMVSGRLGGTTWSPMKETQKGSTVIKAARQCWEALKRFLITGVELSQARVAREKKNAVKYPHADDDGFPKSRKVKLNFDLQLFAGEAADRWSKYSRTVCHGAQCDYVEHEPEFLSTFDYVDGTVKTALTSKGNAAYLTVSDYTGTKGEHVYEAEFLGETRADDYLWKLTEVQYKHIVNAMGEAKNGDGSILASDDIMLRFNDGAKMPHNMAYYLRLIDEIAGDGLDEDIRVKDDLVTKEREDDAMKEASKKTAKAEKEVVKKMNKAKLDEMAEKRLKAEQLFAEVEGKHNIPKASEYDVDKAQKALHVVRNISQAEKMCDADMLANRASGYDVSALVIKPGKRGKLTVHRTVMTRPGTREAWYLPTWGADVMATDEGTPQWIERYTDFYLLVRFPQRRTKNEHYERLLDVTIVKDADGEFWWNERNKKRFTNMVTGKAFRGSIENLMAEGLVYGAYEGKRSIETMTAGQSKQLLMPFVAKKYEDLHITLKYLLTAGASVAIMSEDGDDVSMKDMAQANNRLSQPDAPATPMAHVECAAFYMGKFVNAAKEEYRDGFGFANASWWAKVLTMRAGYCSMFTPDSVSGMAIQCRPAMWKAQAEAVSEDYLHYFVYRRRRFYKMDVVAFVQSEMTDKEVTAFMQACKGKGELAGKMVVICANAEMKTQIEHGDYSCIEILTDRNGNKAPFDPQMPILFNVLSTSHACEDIEHGAHMSSQELQTALMADRNRAHDIAVSRYAAEVESKIDVLKSETAKAPTVAEYLDRDANMGQFMSRISPAAKQRHYLPLLKSESKATMTGLVRDAQGLRIVTAGLYVKIFTDPGMDFDWRFLKVNADGELEILCVGAEEAGYSRAVAIKYPKQHYREYGKCRIITRAEYIARVEASDMGALQKKLLIDKIKHLSKGIVIMPAIELVKNMLAGLDYDGDAAILELLKELCDIVWAWKEGEPLAVCIQSEAHMPADAFEGYFGIAADFSITEEEVTSSEPKKKLAVTNFVGTEFMKMLMELPNDTVGGVTVKHMPFTEILDRLNKGDYASARAAFEFMFGLENGKGEYVPVTREDLGDEAAIKNAKIWADDMAEYAAYQIEHMEYSEENIRKVCDDMITLGRAFQERTIDAVKNYYIVDIPYADNVKRVGLMFRADDPEVRLCWTAEEAEERKEVDEKEARLPYVREKVEVEGTNGRSYVTKRLRHADFVRQPASDTEQPKLFLADAYHRIELDCLKIAGKYAEEALKYDPHMSEAMLAYADAKVENDPKFSAMAHFAMLAKNMWFTCQSLQEKALKDVRKIWRFEDDQLRLQERGVKKRFAPAFEAVGNCMRQVAERLGLESKFTALAAIWASFTKKVGKELVRVSDEEAVSFAETCLGREFVALIHSSMLKAGEQVATEAMTPLSVCLLEDGTKEYFLAGEVWSSDGKTLLAKVRGDEELPNGEYTIRWDEDGKRAYATLPISFEHLRKEADHTKFALKLAFTGKHNYGAFVRAAAKGAEITLLSYDATGKTKEKNLVLVNGKVMANYTGTTYPWFAESFGIEKGSKVYAGAQKACAEIDNKLYSCKVGKLSGFFVGVVEDSSGKFGKAAVVLLDDVKTVDAKSIAIDTTVEPSKVSGVVKRALEKQCTNSGAEDALHSLISGDETELLA